MKSYVPDLASVKNKQSTIVNVTRLAFCLEGVRCLSLILKTLHSYYVNTQRNGI